MKIKLLLVFAAISLLVCIAGCNVVKTVDARVIGFEDTKEKVPEFSDANFTQYRDACNVILEYKGCQTTFRIYPSALSEYPVGKKIKVLYIKEYDGDLLVNRYIVSD